MLSRHPRTIAAQAVPRAARRAENSAAKRETSEKFSSIKIKIKCGREKSQDVAATGTVESAVEAAQAAVVEGARQGAGGGESVPIKFARKRAESKTVPPVRDVKFAKEMLSDFGDPVPVNVGKRFNDARSAVEEIYSNVSRGSAPVNAQTGWEISVSKDEIKKFVQLKHKSAWGVLDSLREPIERAICDRSRPDRKNRKNVRYHRFFANVSGGGNVSPVVLTVREITDKSGYKKYYDLSLVEDGEKPLSDREVKRTNRDFPDSGFSDSPSENISETQGENYSEAFGAGETEDARAFRSELAEVEADEPPTYKILKLGRLSLFLE